MATFAWTPSCRQPLCRAGDGCFGQDYAFGDGSGDDPIVGLLFGVATYSGASVSRADVATGGVAGGERGGVCACRVPTTRTAGSGRVGMSFGGVLPETAQPVRQRGCGAEIDGLRLRQEAGCGAETEATYNQGIPSPKDTRDR